VRTWNLSEARNLDKVILRLFVCGRKDSTVSGTEYLSWDLMIDLGGCGTFT
jgi:hypothetical protein